jgi:branched-chain amino acid aminotransferase
MGNIYKRAYFDDGIKSIDDAKLSVASSAVLYGLSVYTVFPVHISKEGTKYAFRLDDHYQRLINSAHIIGIDTFKADWSKERFLKTVAEVVSVNQIKEDVFVRATVHVNELIPGSRSRGLKTILSVFVYSAAAILPKDGARLKTSVWRRVSDNVIPPRAKVNGAYVNSVLAKQDAIDSGYDDCILLDADGHVCELSAANIFMVRDGKLITPGATNDVLEGINRNTILKIAQDVGIETVERCVDLTELYIADEVFACGTSAYISSVSEVDARKMGDGKAGVITTEIRKRYLDVLYGKNKSYADWLTTIK